MLSVIVQIVKTISTNPIHQGPQIIMLFAYSGTEQHCRSAINPLVRGF